MVVYLKTHEQIVQTHQTDVEKCRKTVKTSVEIQNLNSLEEFTAALYCPLMVS